ncbi:MAG: glycine zipper domain-containing protein [Pirellulales bacterium]
MSERVACLVAALLPALAAWGCQSPYYADRGALLGSLTGAGVGAIVGDAVGNTGAGAAIGAGVGALSGAAIGSGLDEVEAKNRAMIEARMGRPVAAGAVTFQDVVAMTHAGVDEDLIINHIGANGVARPPQTGELIALQRDGVSKRVIEAMQAPPISQGPPVIVHEAPPPVIVDYGPPPYYYHPYYHPYYRPRPRVGWGFSYSSGGRRGR